MEERPHAISVVIPALNEESAIAGAVRSAHDSAVCEILVVDGGSMDRTCSLAQEAGARVIESARGRACQMNAGATAAAGDILLFLHADTVLPRGFAKAVRGAFAGGASWGRFDVQLESGRRSLRLVSEMINLRSRFRRMATGDQAIFVSRAAFDAVGGFPEIPLMEDLELSRMLRRGYRSAALRARVTTSARRWEDNGVWRTVLLMWTLRLAWSVGVDPARLARFYRSPG